MLNLNCFVDDTYDNLAIDLGVQHSRMRLNYATFMKDCQSLLTDTIKQYISINFGQWMKMIDFKCNYQLVINYSLNMLAYVRFVKSLFEQIFQIQRFTMRIDRFCQHKTVNKLYIQLFIISREIQFSIPQIMKSDSTKMKQSPRSK
ncbi:Hypothetical_protein [Hexamita inflata]|uniref:Hypothetical_protein n=1 Tax=Hexamita inflata TaxID=28002 RepID=A0ABP1HGM1_9EUKA